MSSSLADASAEDDGPFGGVAGGGLVYVEDDSDLELSWRRPTVEAEPARRAPIASGVGTSGWLLTRREQMAMAGADGGVRRAALFLLVLAALLSGVVAYAQHVAAPAAVVPVQDQTDSNAPTEDDAPVTLTTEPVLK